jgi:hypothetical protein
MSVTKLLKFFHLRNCFYYICGLIILFSLYLRSIFDIGPDTAIFLDVGKKLATQKRYFYDIFEINFPINMWFYAVQYKIADFFKIHPIILAELVVNLLGFFSIVFLAKNLKKQLFKKDENLFYLLVIFNFLGFFIRPFGLKLFEFGTKTSFFLILFYPYFCFLFRDNYHFSKLENIAKGLIMALIFALKPHYVFFILIVEIYHLIYHKLYRNIFALDKLIAIMFSLIYLLAILHFVPEFFNDIVPMWSEYFNIYSNKLDFLENFYSNLSFMILPYIFVFMVYSRIKMAEIDHLFLAFFLATSFLVLIENSFTVDQFAIFCSVNMGLFARILNLIFSNNFLKFKENLFFLGFFIIIPLTENDLVRLIVFGYSGIFNVWWLMIWYFLYDCYKNFDLDQKRKLFCKKNIKFWVFTYVILLSATLFANKFNYWLSNLISLLSMFVMFFILEKYYYQKISAKFCAFTTFFVMASIFMFVGNFTDSFREIFDKNGNIKLHQKIYDKKFYYHQKYFTNPEDQEMNFYNVHHLSQPFLSYLQKDQLTKLSAYNINSQTAYKRFMMTVIKPSENFAFDYILRDLISNLKNKNTKLIFIDQLRINSQKQSFCGIGYLEYLFFDKNIKQYFLKNYRFENRLIFVKEYQKKDDFFSNIFYKMDQKNEKFLLKEKFQKITSDIEVYVRKN